MNKVITINLNGKAYQIEEGGHALLHSYLGGVGNSLNDNPDKEEILKDFEQAIAEKCDKYITAHKNVVSTEEVQTIIAEMGPIEGDEKSTHSDTATPVIKRLYRIREGAWIAGVCNGIAVFFGIDVRIVRGAFVILTFLTNGVTIPIYIVMALFVPAADTIEEKSFAHGKQFNTQEFMEEMKAKYGKYTEEGYWKKYADTEQKYWKNVNWAWTGMTRLGTGTLSLIGIIALTGIGIVYSIAMWGMLVNPHMFDNKFLVGASPALLTLFITACAFVFILPITKMVTEASRHAWNKKTPKRSRIASITGLVLWLIAMGFAIVVSIQSLPEQNKTYVPYGTKFWIGQNEICIGGNYFCNPESGIEEGNKRAVENTVRNFGETLQQVSLLGPAEILTPQMEKVYGSYITPELLLQWQNDPANALGRTTSSPYPDHINLDDTVRNEDGSYSVTANVIEMTSNPQDRFIDSKPVTFTVISLNNDWRISAVEIGKH